MKGIVETKGLSEYLGSETLIEVPQEVWPAGLRRPERVLLSRDHLVQVYAKENGARRLSVSSVHLGPDGRWVDGIGWDVLQRLKAEAGFGDLFAVEIYPATAHTINDANIRHLWVLDNPPDFAWRRMPRWEDRT